LLVDNLADDLVVVQAICDCLVIWVLQRCFRIARLNEEETYQVSKC
jgi:hypothetical protein